MDIVRVHGGLTPGMEGVIDFSANINPLGPPAPVLEGLRDRMRDAIATYPDPLCGALRGALSSYLGVGEGNIIVGNGSTQLIYLLVNALRPSRALVIEPSFSEYRNALILSGSRVEDFSLREEGGFCLPVRDLLRVLSRGYDMVFLANPSSPRGEFISADGVMEIARVTERLGTWLVVDEAFIDFCGGGSFAGKAVEMERVIVLRSMTKFFSLPGLRLGYGISGKGVIDLLSRHLPPWSVNGPAQVAGILALKERGFVERTLSWLEGERGWMIRAIRAVEGLQPYPSHTNFLLIRIEREGINSRGLQEMLLSRGIYVRDCSSFRGLGDRFFRVAILGRDENRLLLEALKDIFKG